MVQPFRENESTTTLGITDIDQGPKKRRTATTTNVIPLTHFADKIVDSDLKLAVPLMHLVHSSSSWDGRWMRLNTKPLWLGGG
jgi:hypothetical protein